MDKKTFEFLKKVDEIAQKIRWGESAKTECTNCSGVLHVGRNELNGHIWAKCEKCGYFFIE